MRGVRLEVGKGVRRREHRRGRRWLRLGVGWCRVAFCKAVERVRESRGIVRRVVDVFARDSRSRVSAQSMRVGIESEQSE